MSSSSVVPITPDVLVQNEGTVFLFCPLTALGKEWMSTSSRTHRGSDMPGRRASFRVGPRAGHEGCGLVLA